MDCCIEWEVVVARVALAANRAIAACVRTRESFSDRMMDHTKFQAKIANCMSL